MKNKKLRHLLKSIKHIESLDVQVLSTNEEHAILGGSCPMLTTCGTFTNCTSKFKEGNDDDTVEIPTTIEIL